MGPAEEQDVVRGLLQGNAESWQSLYDAYAEGVWRFVARQLGSSRSEIADVVQETFLAAARSARNYDASRGTIWLWLCGIARNQIALHFRKHQRRERLQQAIAWLAASESMSRWLVCDIPTPTEIFASSELALLVRTTLQELPADYELLLSGKYLDGMSVEQLAHDQRLTPTAVRSKLARARRAFREAFERLTQADTSARETL